MLEKINTIMCSECPCGPQLCICIKSCSVTEVTGKWTCVHIRYNFIKIYYFRQLHQRLILVFLHFSQTIPTLISMATLGISGSICSSCAIFVVDVPGLTFLSCQVTHTKQLLWAKSGLDSSMEWVCRAHTECMVCTCFAQLAHSMHSEHSVQCTHCASHVHNFWSHSLERFLSCSL